MQDFSTMSKQMMNIASPGKMPPPTMQGRGPMVAPQMPGPAPGAAPGAMPPGGGDDQRLMQIIQQIAQQIEAMTGVPATPEQIQTALAEVMPGMGAGAAQGPPSGAAPEAQMGGQPLPPQLGMRR